MIFKHYTGQVFCYNTEAETSYWIHTDHIVGTIPWDWRYSIKAKECRALGPDKLDRWEE